MARKVERKQVQQDTTTEVDNVGRATTSISTPDSSNSQTGKEDRRPAERHTVVEDGTRRRNSIEEHAMSIGSIEEYTVDLSSVPDPDPLPVREYEATVRAIEVYLSKTSGNPTVKISYFVAPDQYPVDYDADNAPDGVTLNSFGSVNCGALPSARQPTKLGLAKLRRLFESHGIKAPRLALRPQDALGGSWGVDESDLSMFVGCRVGVSVVHEMYEGQPVAKIKDVKPLD